MAVPLLAAAAAAAATFWLCDGWQAIADWQRRHGHHAVAKRTSTLAALAGLPQAWLASAPAAKIELAIAFRNLQVLRAGQEDALRRGFIGSTAKKAVPAEVGVGDAHSKCRVRLKGDHLDHVAGRKLSLRVQLTGDPPVLGLRAFSLQAPPSKGFQLEALFHATVRHCGVLSPRYEFVRAGCNGDDLGVMALEEHCGTELLLRQGRRAGAIVRLEEEPMFAAQARLRTSDPRQVVLDDHRAAAVQPLAGGADAECVGAAVGLLRGFVTGALSPSQAFVADELGAYLAVCELWGSWHALRWHNLRFYLDPTAGRLVPIGFDGNLHMRRSVGWLVAREEPIVAWMLADPEVFAAFRRHLRALCADLLGPGSLVQELAAVQTAALPVLRSEYWLLQPFDLNELKARAQWLAEVEGATFVAQPADPHIEPILVSEVADGRFTLRNRTPWDVEVRGLRWVDGAGQAKAVELPEAWRPVLLVRGRPEQGPTPEVALELPRPAGERALQLEVEARVATVSERYFVRAVPQPDPPDVGLSSAPTLGQVLTAHPWLRAEDDGRTLRAAPGRHALAHTVVLPRGIRLLVEAGTELTFAAQAGLVVQGETALAGSANAPIVLAGETDEGWLGVAVLGDADAHSRWRHVTVRGARGVRAGPLAWPAGVLFRAGTVELEDVLLSGSTGEAALEVHRAAASLLRLRVERTAGAGLASRGACGRMSDCVFTDIGRDAAVFHGGSLEVRACTLRRVGGVGLVAGDGARVDVAGLTIAGAAVGVVARDGAVLTVTDSAIDDARDAAAIALCVEPAFGPAALLLHACRATGPVLVQHGSQAVRDGSALPTQEIDPGVLSGSTVR